MIGAIRFIASTLMLIVLTSGQVLASEASDSREYSAALAASISADAKDDPAVEAPGAFMQGIGDVTKRLTSVTANKVAGQLFQKAVDIANSTTTFALILGGSLATLYLVVEMINYMSSPRGAFTQVIVDIALPMAITAYLINNYSMLIQMFAAPATGSGGGGILQGIRGITSDPATMIVDMYGSIFRMMGNTVKQAGAHYVEVWSLVHPLNTAVAFGDLFFTLIFALVMAYLVLTGLAETLGLILLGPFLCAVGVAFGPILIAGLVTPWTREYFSKWVGFIVASAVFTGVLGVCISLSTVLFESFAFNKITSDDTPTATGLIVGIVLLATINSLLEQAPGIASAMIPGHVGVSSGSGGAIAKAAGSAKKRVVNSGKLTANILGKGRGKAKSATTTPATTNPTVTPTP